MRLIAVDIGNSSTIFGVPSFHVKGNNEIAQTINVTNNATLESASFDWFDVSHPHFWCVCSVNAPRASELKEWISKHRPEDRFHLIQANDIEMETQFHSRETLGRDRLLGAWQARQLFPQGRLVVIDAGTAVTLDLVDANSIFRGGMIFPGARTMLRALSQQTSALPDLTRLGIDNVVESTQVSNVSTIQRDVNLIDGHFKFPCIGKSTQQAILIGVYQTQLSTLRCAVETIRSQLPAERLNVVATGGGVIELQPWLPEDWHFEPKLLLSGALAIGQKLMGTI